MTQKGESFGLLSFHEESVLSNSAEQRWNLFWSQGKSQGLSTYRGTPLHQQKEGAFFEVDQNGFDFEVTEIMLVLEIISPGTFYIQQTEIMCQNREKWLWADSRYSPEKVTAEGQTLISISPQNT